MSGVSCPSCGSLATATTHSTELGTGRWTALVLADAYTCGSCGEQFFTPGQIQGNLKRAADVVRERKGIVSPDWIKRFRARHSLTQAQLEKLLGLSSKMVVRWEKGTVLPSLSANEMMLLLDSCDAALQVQAAKKQVVIQVQAAGPWVSTRTEGSSVSLNDLLEFEWPPQVALTSERAVA